MTDGHGARAARGRDRQGWSAAPCHRADHRLRPGPASASGAAPPGRTWGLRLGAARCHRRRSPPPRQVPMA